MSCDHIQNLIASDKAIVIDVRTPAEYSRGRIRNAVNIPLNQIHETRLPSDKTILVYCQTGNRSEFAKDALKKQGYNVINIGGIHQFVGCVDI